MWWDDRNCTRHVNCWNGNVFTSNTFVDDRWDEARRRMWQWQQRELRVWAPCVSFPISIHKNYEFHFSSTISATRQSSHSAMDVICQNDCQWNESQHETHIQHTQSHSNEIVQLSLYFIVLFNCSCVSQWMTRCGVRGREREVARHKYLFLFWSFTSISRTESTHQVERRVKWIPFVDVSTERRARRRKRKHLTQSSWVREYIK